MSEFEAEEKQTGKSRLGARIGAYWVRGALYILVALLISYAIQPFVERIAPLTSNVEFIVAITVFIVVAPTVMGWISAKFIVPIINRWRTMKDMQSWEDRLVDELSPGRDRGFPVVLVSWPSEENRTIGLLASRYRSSCGTKELAIVYFPGVPHPSRRGYTRVVSSECIEVTDWSMSDLFKNCISFGSTGRPMFNQHAGTEE